MKNKGILPVLLIICAFLVLSFACGAPLIQPPVPPVKPVPPATSLPDTKEKVQTPPGIVEEPVNFPVTVTDDIGRQVKLTKLPQKIVSLAPSITEILFSLGLGDRIAGVTDYCDYPEAAKSKPRVASYTTPNIEKLVSMAPDLVIVESIHEKTVLPALEKLGFTVFLTSAKSVDVILQDIISIGKMNGKVNTAAQIITAIKKRIAAVSEKTAGLQGSNRLKTLYVVWHQPIWTMGAETFNSDLIYLAGGINIYAADFKESRIVSLESVINKNPQVIIVTGMATTGDQVFDSIKKEDRLKTVDALKMNRVYKISDANLIERPGPRIIDGLEEMARLMHPELFGPAK